MITDIFNGYLVGFVARMSVDAGGIGVLWKLFPHGIFELPAVIMSIGIGMKMGIDIFRKDKKQIARNFKEALRFLIFVVLPLLIIAGIIEGILIFL